MLHDHHVSHHPFSLCSSLAESVFRRPSAHAISSMLFGSKASAPSSGGDFGPTLPTLIGFRLPALSPATVDRLNFASTHASNEPPGNRQIELILWGPRYSEPTFRASSRVVSALRFLTVRNPPLQTPVEFRPPFAGQTARASTIRQPLPWSAPAKSSNRPPVPSSR